MPRVVIGVDPHKASNTLVVIDAQRAGAGPAAVRQRPGRLPVDEDVRPRVTATGCGRSRVPAVSVPGWRSGWSPRVSRCSTCPPGCPPGSARWVVAAAARPTTPTRSRSPLPACAPGTCRRSDPTTPPRSCGCSPTRRQELVAQRIATVNRLHDVLCQLIPGGAKRHLRATKARPAAVGGAAPRRGREGPQAARPGLPR